MQLHVMLGNQLVQINKKGQFWPKIEINLLNNTKWIIRYVEVNVKGHFEIC